MFFSNFCPFLSLFFSFQKMSLNCRKTPLCKQLHRSTICKFGTSLKIISISAAIKRIKTWRAGHILHTQFQIDAECPFMNLAVIHSAHKRFNVKQLWWHNYQLKTCQILYYHLGAASTVSNTEEDCWLAMSGRIWQHQAFIPTIKLELQLHSKCRHTTFTML